jgi:hypothetical protein
VVVGRDDGRGGLGAVEQRSPDLDRGKTNKKFGHFPPKQDIKIFILNPGSLVTGFGFSTLGSID